MTVNTTSIYTDPENMRFNAAWVFGALILIFLIGTVASVIFMKMVAPRPELVEVGMIAAIGSIILAITCAFGGILEIRRQVRKRDKVISKLDGILVQRGGFSGF